MPFKVLQYFFIYNLICAAREGLMVAWGCSIKQHNGSRIFLFFWSKMDLISRPLRLLPFYFFFGRKFFFWRMLFFSVQYLTTFFCQDHLDTFFQFDRQVGHFCRLRFLGFFISLNLFCGLLRQFGDQLLVNTTFGDIFLVEQLERPLFSEARPFPAGLMLPVLRPKQ